MRERSVGLDEAKEVCRGLIREHVVKHLDVVEHAKAGNLYSPDLVRFLDAMSYTISGNVVWSMSCPRYHPDTQFNPQQQEWIANGIPDHLRKEKRVRPPKAQPWCTRPMQPIDKSPRISSSSSDNSSSSNCSPTSPLDTGFSAVQDAFLDLHLSPLHREVCGPSPGSLSPFPSPLSR